MPRKEKKVCGRQIRGEGRVFQPLDAVLDKPAADAGSTLRWRVVVPVEKPLVLNHGRPLLLQLLHEAVQDP